MSDPKDASTEAESEYRANRSGELDEDHADTPPVAPSSEHGKGSTDSTPESEYTPPDDGDS